MKKLVEKVTCNKCNISITREIETINHRDDTNTLRNKLSAVVIKKHKCKCGETNNTSEFITINESESIA